MVAVVRGDGVKLPPYLIKGEREPNQPPPRHRPLRGLTNHSVKPWIAEFMSQVSEPSLLIWDRSLVHISKSTLHEFASYRFEDGSRAIHIAYMPPKGALLLSPLATGVFSEFKSHYKPQGCSTFELKKKTVTRAWNRISKASVRKWFQHCGLTGEETLESLRSRFLQEIKGPAGKEYREIREFYNLWFTGKSTVPGAKRARRVIY